MEKVFPTLEEALSFIKEVNTKLLPHHETYREFQELMQKFRERKIPAELVASNVKNLFNNEPDLFLEFQKFLPINLQSRQDERKNQEINFQKSEVVCNNASREKTIKEALEYFNRVQRGLKDRPDLLSKFFNLMGEYRNDLDQGKLKHGLISLFEFHPEYEIEFTQFIANEPLPKKRVYESKPKVIQEDSLEGIMNGYEDEMIANDLLISRINLAIKNIEKLVRESTRNHKRVEVTSYLTCTNLKDIMKYCKVDFVKSRNVSDDAYHVVGKLRCQLEKTKTAGDVIRRNREIEIGKFQERKMD